MRAERGEGGSRERGGRQLTPSPQVPLLQVSGPLLVVQLLETPLLCLVSYARWGPLAPYPSRGDPGRPGGQPFGVWAWLYAPGPSSVGASHGLQEGRVLGPK